MELLLLLLVLLLLLLELRPSVGETGGGPRAWCQKSAAGFILKTGLWMSTGCWMSADIGLSSPGPSPGEARRSNGVDIVVDSVRDTGGETSGN